MKRRKFLELTSAAAAGFSAGCGKISFRRRRPNVVFVYADQWRAGATGYAGNPDVITPHLDALAAESINFKNAVSCCPVCSPARASLITGQYPLTHGVFLNDVCLNDRGPSIAKAFNAAGYTTGWIGKWHIDGHGRTAYIPPERRQGFQYFKALECSHRYNESAYYDNDDPEVKYWDGYDAIAQTKDAADFIMNHRADPFILFLAWGPPHDPYLTAPEEFRQLYDPDRLSLPPNVSFDDRLIRRNQWQERAETMEKTPALLTAGYYAHCTALDRCMGDLRAAIRAAGIEDDTILVFTSDHGDMLASQGQWNKQQPYDESIRIPFLMKLPAQSGAREIAAPINMPDIFPTLCELCNVPVPAGVEGRSFVPEIYSGAPADDVALIAHYHAFGQWSKKNGGKEWRGVRTPRYTFVHDLNGPWLLFDNEADPYQANNLVNLPEFSKVQQQLDAQLQEKLRQTNDQFEPGMNYVQRWNYEVDETGTVRVNYTGTF